MQRAVVRSLGLALALASPLAAQDRASGPDLQGGLQLAPQNDVVYEQDGLVVAADATGTYVFGSWSEYFDSPFVQQNGKRCAAAPPGGTILQAQVDCTNTNTTISPQYDPSGPAHTINVVVHILYHPNGAGNIPDSQVFNQIDVLNEDFQALAGSLGANGNDANIQFNLAGITRTKSGQYFNDGGGYWNALAWDTTQYLNIYTNTASGNLGYAFVPNGGGVVGNIADRVVIHYTAFGKPGSGGPPYDLGRTTTHEVGHYLGLYHTFDPQNSCPSASGCYNNGDLICDTNPEFSPNFSPCNKSSCGSSDPTDNYMDYSDDICMMQFTSEQVNRMRCTLESWRPGLLNTGPVLPGKATSPAPSNGATGVSTSATLSWASGTNTDSFDVYFGTDSTPDAGELQGNQTATSFDPGTLASSTTYYWRIDSVNGDGTTTGDVWSFTTATGGGGGIALSVNGYKVKGKWHADLTWSGASGTNVEIYRDGQLLTTTANDGAYTDATTFKGGGSLTYQVCETGGGACSNSATANF